MHASCACGTQTSGGRLGHPYGERTRDTVLEVMNGEFVGLVGAAGVFDDDGSGHGFVGRLSDVDSFVEREFREADLVGVAIFGVACDDEADAVSLDLAFADGLFEHVDGGAVGDRPVAGGVEGHLDFLSVLHDLSRFVLSVTGPEPMIILSDGLRSGSPLGQLSSSKRRREGGLGIDGGGCEKESGFAGFEGGEGVAGAAFGWRVGHDVLSGGMGCGSRAVFIVSVRDEGWSRGGSWQLRLRRWGWRGAIEN